MMENNEEERDVIYSYVKDGKEYFTPNEQIAQQRSDNGEYYKQSYNRNKSNKEKK